MGVYDTYEIGCHWRQTHPQRNYETHVCSYNDFQPEPNTYDYLSSDRGWKWELVKRFLSTLDHRRYEYIGFFDDDLITDYNNINTSIQIAREVGATLFQLSTLLGSESTHRVLHQQQGVLYTETKFVEGMGPFIHNSLIPTFKELLDFYEFKSGWGLDVILAKALKAKTVVIHKASMYHPPQNIKGSYYNKDEAFKEMYEVQNITFPRWMKHKYNEDSSTCHYDSTEYERVVL